MLGFWDSLTATLGADGNGVLFAAGSAMALAAALMMRSCARRWRHGIEARADIVKTYGPKMADIRFKDDTGKVYRIERCLAPRYGMFVEGGTRVLTYLPGKPEGWWWRPRVYHRWMTFFSLYIVVLGLGMASMGLLPLWPAWLQHLASVLTGHGHREGWMEALPPPR
jgi:hypothetical protein